MDGAVPVLIREVGTTAKGERVEFPGDDARAVVARRDDGGATCILERAVERPIRQGHVFQPAVSAPAEDVRRLEVAPFQRVDWAWKDIGVAEWVASLVVRSFLGELLK